MVTENTDICKHGYIYKLASTVDYMISLLVAEATGV